MTVASPCKWISWLGVFLFLLVSSHSCSDDATGPDKRNGTQPLSWAWQNPVPHCRLIWDGCAFDNTNAIIVGEDAIVAQTIDGGANWTLSNTQQVEYFGDIVAVDFTNPGTGVGIARLTTGQWTYAHCLIRTSDAGVTWTRMNLNIPATDFLTDVEFLDSNKGVIVGEGYDFDSDKQPPIIYRTADGGASWSRDTIGGSGFGITDVDFVDANRGLAVSHGGHIYRTTDGGAIWELRFESSELKAVSFADSLTALAVGGSSSGFRIVLRTEDGGATWSVLSREASAGLSDVFMIDHSTAIAVSPFLSAILRTIDGGLTWAEIPTGIPIESLEGVECGVHRLFFADHDVGWAVGRCGTILKTTDGGLAWSLQTKGTRTDLTAVDFATPEVGVAVGRKGVIVHTSDEGRTWNHCSSGTTQDLWDVNLISQDVGTAVGAGGTILRTTDGGITWATQESNTQQDLSGVSFYDGDTGAVVGSEATVLWTDNGGATWAPRSVPEIPSLNLSDISLVSGQVGTAVGTGGAILHTTDGGSTWVLQNSGTKSNLRKVRFADADRGTAISGLILYTKDGGRKWEISLGPNPDLPMWELVDIAYFDGVTAVVLTSYSQILRSGDGGATWSQEYYWDISGIQGGDFLTKNVGTIVGEHGMIWHTQ